jgi:aryl-alcohol dehydrogenase-like predicted oxidoreductase
MRYKLLGKSGLRVSELCLGTMTFGEGWGWGASQSESHQIFDGFVEAGGNFLDTANNYTDGTSERYVGECIASDREHFVVSTKYTLSMRRDDPNASGNQRKNMVQALEASLKRLNTDYIDLYWVHAWDFLTPVEEVMRGLDDLVRAGKVLYVGISDTPAWVVAQANTLAAWRGWTPFVGVQIEYSLLQREPERDLLPMARAFDLAVLAWSPLAGGLLTGKYQAQQASASGESRRMGGQEGSLVSERHARLVKEVQAVADEIGCTPAQVALNWLRHQADVVIPVLGSRRVAQLQENLDCLKFPLTREQMQRLDAASRIALGFPYDFLASDGVRELVYGGTYALTDPHQR